MEKVAIRLREARERAGLTQGQAEEYAGIGPKYISKLERGENKPPTWILLAKLARQYRTSTDYLLGLVDNPRAPENKTLPEGGSEMLEYLSGMSDRGRADLLAVARVLYQSDQEWLSYQMSANMAEAISSTEELETLLTTLDKMAAKLGGMKAALTAVETMLLAELEADEKRQETN